MKGFNGQIYVVITYNNLLFLLLPNRKLGPEIKDIQMTISTSFKMKLELEYDKYRKDVRKENG